MKQLIFFVAFCLYIGKNAVAQNPVITQIPNTLSVSGDLMVIGPAISVTNPPAAYQTLTMNNSQYPDRFLEVDSTGRIYDPGGPSGNYINNLTGHVAILPTVGAYATEITFETMQLMNGDSLIIYDYTSPGFPNSPNPNSRLLAVGNGYNTTGTWIFNTTGIYITFKSNFDGINGAGFSLLFKRIYSNNHQLPDFSGIVGNALLFDAEKGSLRSGRISGGGSSTWGNYSTAIGYLARAGGSYSTALGYSANASGSYSNALGLGTTASGNYSTALGGNTSASGNFSTAMGNNTSASGTYSTAMGRYVSTSNKSGAFIIGDNSTTTIMNSSVDNNFRARFAGGYRLYTSSDYTTSAVLFSNDNAWSTSSDKYSKEKFEDIDGEDFLKKIAGMKLTTWNYKTQDPQKFRHYGPMAQDFYAAFGKDKYGTIGNDSTINQADFDGVNLIAIQALEKRTSQQKETMEKDITALKKELEDLKAMLLQQKKELDEHKAEKNPCNLLSVNEKKE